jgi:hypothetical protein
MDIKLLVAVGDGEIVNLSLPQSLWFEDQEFALYQVAWVIEESMRKAAQDCQEEADYSRWAMGGLRDAG